MGLVELVRKGGGRDMCVCVCGGGGGDEQNNTVAFSDVTRCVYWW